MRAYFNGISAYKVIQGSLAACGLAGALYVACAAIASQMDYPRIESTPRPMTAQEASFAQTFFGELDTDAIRIFQEEDSFKTFFTSLIGLAAGYDIAFFGRNAHSADYTSGTVLQKSYAMHEIGHVWQHEQELKSMLNDTWTPPDPDCAGGGYSYFLRDGSTFGDFCPEQQASMIENYVRHFLSDGNEVTIRDYLPMFTTFDFNHDRLREVVEGQFPGARQLRIESAHARREP